MTPEPEEGGDEDDAIDGDEYAEPRQRDKDGMREPMRKREAPKKSKKRKEKTGTPAPVEEEEDVDPAVGECTCSRSLTAPLLTALRCSPRART